MQEFKGDLKGLHIAYVGDANNVANSWIEASLLLGFTLSIASPEKYGPTPDMMERIRSSGTISVTGSPAEAVRGADVVNTDVWVSMGMEKEKKERKKAFEGFIVNDALMAHARPDAIVLHCLPAHKNEEISEGVFERFQHVIFTQAENRLHAQKALMEWLLKEV